MVNLHSKSFLTKHWILFFLLALPSLAVRFLWLGNVPPGVNHDEVDVVDIARTYAYYGKTPLGAKFPQSLIGNQISSTDDSLLPLFLAPIYRFLPFNVFMARLPMVLINIVAAVIMFILCYKLSFSNLFAGITCLVFLYSPWSLVLSRYLTQAPLALLLILLAVTTYVSSYFTSSSIMFLLAFVSYHGAKPLTILLGLILPIWSNLTFRRFSIKKIIKFWSILFIGIGVYFLVVLHTPDSTILLRKGETNLLNLSTYSRVVEELRRTSIQSPITNIVFNKPNSFLNYLAQKYLGFFSPNFLFFNGDPGANSRFTDHGVALISDAPLFLLGFSGLFSYPIASLGILLLIIGPVGTIVNTLGISNIYRGFMFLPGFVIIVSMGIFNIYKKFNKLLIITATIIYAIFVLNFWYLYFFHFPISISEQSFFGQRVLSNYLVRTSNTITVVANIPLQLLQEFDLFLSSRNSTRPMLLLQTGPWHYKNINVVSVCPDTISADTTLIVQTGINCQSVSNYTPLVIQDQKDTGTLWKIYSDRLCQGFASDYWRRYSLRSDYALESMSTPNFCNRWLAKFK
jgi:hypothetical protein